MKLIYKIFDFMYCTYFLSLGKSLFVDRLFEKLQQKSPRAKHIRIRLIERCIDMDSLIKNLSEKLASVREQDPVLLHIDTAGVSMQEFVSADNLLCVSCTRVLFFHFFLMPGSFRTGGAVVPSVNLGLSL